jgi:hypothetical protein
VIKWKLMLTTLPVVFAVVVARLVMDQFFGLSGWIDFSDVSPVLAAAAFLVGFMLAGTMADYKESEKLPSELVTTLETIEDLVSVASFKKEFDSVAAHRGLIELGERILDWLARRTPIDAVYTAIEALNPHFQSMDMAGATAHANRSVVMMNTVRRIIGRMDVISRTGFLATGYAILDVMVVAVVLLLLASRYKTLVAEYTLIVSITMIYVYMVQLIRDVDDPFEYAPDLSRMGAAEIDLFPITEFLARGKARLQGMAAPGSGAT